MNKKELSSFMKDESANELNVWHTHRDQVSAVSEDFSVTYRKTSKGLTASLCEQTINLEEPALLESVDIEKPWGKEIWYTGVEERGESRVKTSENTSIPLSLYLSLAPDQISNNLLPLLLKVLAPLPTEPKGNLYFEVHEKKEEVYIVTHIDQKAWPNGIGAIRYGINQEKRKQYVSDEKFRLAYLESVKQYEKLRKKIDKGLEIDPELERKAKKDMNAFTTIKKIQLGDVIRVPTWVPHSLQHGVRVVEFQTPTYERFIISFEQKVLTQKNWDSEYAIKRMHLDPPIELGPSNQSPGIERLADFSSFSAIKVDFSQINHFNLSNTTNYAICLPIGTTCRVGDLIVPPETACLIPNKSLDQCEIHGESGGYALIASPSIQQGAA